MLSNEDSLNAFLQNAGSDRHLRLSISRNTVFAIIFSLIVHGLFLLLITPVIDSKQEAVLPARELTVSMAPPSVEKKLKPDDELTKPLEPASKPLPEPTTKIDRPVKPKTKVKPKPDKTIEPPADKVPDVLVAEVPKLINPVPEKIQPNLTIPKEDLTKDRLPKDLPLAEAPQPDVSQTQAPKDMMAFVNQKRAAREANESNAAKINAEATAKELGPSAEQLRDEKIKRNFENGTNGIFEITSLGSRNATFAFRGWTSDFGNSRKEFFEVEAKSGQDVRLIMIKKMISLIRQHYKGDFNWESHRLDRTIIMSARIEDSEGLEDFMMAEFFGSNYKTSQLN